jgi:hypothetical protein
MTPDFGDFSTKKPVDGLSNQYSWLSNPRLEVHSLYGPLIQQALIEWGRRKLYLALDTSMLWDEFCLIRIAVVYRGRAVPLCGKCYSTAAVVWRMQPIKTCCSRLRSCCPSAARWCSWLTVALPIPI